MIIGGLDFETSGQNPATNSVVEAGLVWWCTELHRPIKSQAFLVFDPNAVWEEGVSEINGITPDQCANFGLTSENALKQVIRFYQQVDVLCGHNCFIRDTSVLMADWTWKSIWRIKPGDLVMSMKYGRMYSAKVLRCLHEHDDREWMEVKVDGAYNRGVGKWGTPGVICTSDHEWIGIDGTRKQAKELVPEDRIPLPKPGAFDFVLGTLLGDAYTDGKVLSFSHADEKWASAKADHLRCSAHPFLHKGFKESTHWRAATQIPGWWRDHLYSGEQKVWMTPNDRALAVFYGDDGCLKWAKPGENRRKTWAYEATMSLHAFTPAQREEIRQEFRSRFGDCCIYNEAVLHLHKQGSQAFFTAIAPFLHPSMERKLPPEYRGRYNGWMEGTIPQTGFVVSSLPAKLSKTAHKSSRSKYCLEVEGSHCFFTRSGLVSNCTIFDKLFYENWCTKLNYLDHIDQGKTWIDTKIDIVFPKGWSNRLKYLACEHGILHYNAHGALPDATVMLEILDRYDLGEVLESAKSPTLAVEALVSFDERNKAKALGYYWRPAPAKQWIKSVKACRFAEEEMEAKKAGFKIRIVE